MYQIVFDFSNFRSGLKFIYKKRVENRSNKFRCGRIKLFAIIANKRTDSVAIKWIIIEVYVVKTWYPIWKIFFSWNIPTRLMKSLCILLILKIMSFQSNIVINLQENWLNAVNEFRFKFIFYPSCVLNGYTIASTRDIHLLAHIIQV